MGILPLDIFSEQAAPATFLFCTRLGVPKKSLKTAFFSL